MKNARIIIFIATILVVLVIMIFGIFPVSRTILNRYKEISSNNSQSKESTATNQDLVTRNSNGELTRLTQILTDLVPKTKNQTEATNLLQNIAKANNLTAVTVTINPNPTATNTLPFNLKASGSFADIQNFTLKIGANQRLVTLDKISIGSVNNILTLTTDGKMYFIDNVDLENTDINTDITQKTIEQINSFVSPVTPTKTDPLAGFGRTDPFSNI